MSVPTPAFFPALVSVGRMRNVLAALCVVAGCVLLLAPTVRSLHDAWTDFGRLTYTHGYLIASISLLALVRAALTFEGPAPQRWMALLLVPMGLCWMLALRSGVELLHQLMFPVIAFVALAAAFGAANARKAWFAFAYLYFAVSVWDALTGPLQSLSVIMVQVMLAATSVPVHVSGTVLQIPEGAFTIDPGCSGLHYLIVALSLAVVVGEVHRDSWKARLRQIALAAALALLSNWIRISCVVLAGHLTDMQHYLVRVEHYKVGWCVFALAMLVFFWRVSRMGPAPAAPVTPARPEVPTGVLVAGAALSLAMLAVGPVLVLLRPMLPATPSSDPLLRNIAGWDGPAEYEGPWDPLYPDSDRAERGVYRRDEQVVVGFVAQYYVQRQGKELVSYDNSLLNGLRPRAGGGRLESDPAGRWQRVDARGVESVMVWRLRVGSRRFATNLPAQLFYGLASLAGPQRSAVIAAVAACLPDCDAALAGARGLVDALDFERGGER
jgi:exosortase